jgi:hypothetical protein
MISHSLTHTTSNKKAQQIYNLLPNIPYIYRNLKLQVFLAEVQYMSTPPSDIFITSSSDKSVFLSPHPALSYGWAIRRRNFAIEKEKS